MRDLKRAGILTNFVRDPDFSKTRDVINALEKNGIECLAPYNEAEHMEPDTWPEDAFFKKSDFIITLGGDGTILSIAEKAAQFKIPVMGINIGNLGYLTDCSYEDAEKSIKRLIVGSFHCEKRAMLKATVTSGGKLIRTRHCLNDVCVTRGETPKLIRFDLLINDNLVDNYSADGIIISTPTGSTAYNLSSGGPILIPTSEMIAITPICPHMLTTRPIVVSAGDRIKVVVKTSQNEAMLTLDGHAPKLLNNGDVVEAERSDCFTEIIKTNKLGFYDILRKKLIYSGIAE